MPNIDVKCQTCGEVSEVFRPLAMYPATPACPKCDAPTEQIHLPQSARVLPPAVVVFRAPDGSLRFPGDSNGLSAANYAKQGYERLEYRGWASVRELERTVNKSESAKIHRQLEKRQREHEAFESGRRSLVFEGLKNGFVIPETIERMVNGERQVVRTGRLKTVRMSEMGKDIVRAAIAHNNITKRHSTDPGFRVEAYSENRSNRDESRDRDGRRRRD